jgi:glycosyltransferase involved in cell wall biosynthesis
MGNDGKPLRVGLIGRYSPDAVYMRGGVQAAFAYLVNGLVELDALDIHLLTFRQSDWLGADLIKQNGMTIHLLPVYPRFERLRNYRSYQTILNERLAQIRPDIIHAQEAAADALVALRSGYPTVVTAHGIRYEDQKYCGSWNRRIRFIFDGVLTERYVIRHSRYLIAISHYVAEYFAKLLSPEAKRYFIPNAIDKRFYCLPVSTDRPIVLFAGRVIPVKHVMELVRAFALVIQEVPLARLRIAGECVTDPSYFESINEWVRQAGLVEYIDWLGELRQEDLLDEYARCSLLALCSAQENAPVVIAQAMAAGKPVVATQVGGVAEMVGQDGERGMLVKVGDVNGLAKAIVDILKDSALRVSMGAAGRRFALTNYHPDHVARCTAEVYREIIAREAASYG